MELLVGGPTHRVAIAQLLSRAADGLNGRRGGDALRRTWLGDRSASEALSALEDAVAPAGLHVVLLGDGTGLSCAWVGPEAGSFTVWVDPESRHHGAGPALADAALEWLELQEVGAIDVLGPRDEERP